MLAEVITGATSIEIGLVSALVAAISGWAVHVYSTRQTLQVLREQVAEIKAEAAKNTRDRQDRAAIARYQLRGDSDVHETVS